MGLSAHWIWFCRSGLSGTRYRLRGRARPSSDVSEIKVAFRIPPPEWPTPNIALSWNVAPTDPLPVVRYDAKERQRSLQVMRYRKTFFAVCIEMVLAPSKRPCPLW